MMRSMQIRRAKRALKAVAVEDGKVVKLTTTDHTEAKRFDDVKRYIC